MEDGEPSGGNYLDSWILTGSVIFHQSVGEIALIWGSVAIVAFRWRIDFLVVACVHQEDMVERGAILRFGEIYGICLGIVWWGPVHVVVL